MRYCEIVEGGWASVKTQDTKITPPVMAEVVKNLPQFEQQLNRFLSSEGLPEIRIGNPVGSGTYWKRDLEQNPDKEYGDIDVHFVIPRNSELSTNKNVQLFMDAVKKFSDQHSDYETESGKNVIFNIGNNRFVQVDLVAVFDDRLEWAKTQAPEHGTKGVLSSSLYSALAQVLDISISVNGIQARTQGGELVPFRMRKDTELVNISDDKDNWGVDIARFFGASEPSDLLQKNPGIKEEIRIQDIVNTIKGIAETLESAQSLPSKFDSAQDLLNSVRSVYLNKIDAVINSTKFDKAESPQAKQKAQETKKMLQQQSQKIASMLQ